MIVIGLCGAEGAGKSTAARILQDEYNGIIVPFAAPLKQMLEALGVPPAHLYGSPEAKAEALEMLGGNSARYAMQTLGTEWGRQCMGPEFWAAIWRAKVADMAAKMAGRHGALLIVADDVRFPSEVDAIHAASGRVYCVTRNAAHYAEDRRRAKSAPLRAWRRVLELAGRAPHASTQYAALDVDGVIENGGGIDVLRANVAMAVGSDAFALKHKVIM